MPKKYAVKGGIGPRGMTYYVKYSEAKAVAEKRGRKVRRYNPESGKWEVIKSRRK